MDVNKKIKLHPSAWNFLFENFETLRRIFSDVLGQLGIDYISMTLINRDREIFFLSSTPSVEINLIEKELWQQDYIYQEKFISQRAPKLWSEMYALSEQAPLRAYKINNQNLIEGISIPIDYEGYKAILSFGFKKINPLVEMKSNDHEKLVTLGKYCLNRISNAILFPDKKRCNTKPKLTLIINKLGEI